MNSATNDGPPSLVFIEANASGSGVKAVARAAELGLNPVFCANDPQRFLDLPGGDAVRRATIITVDTYSADAVTNALLHAGVAVAGVVALDEYHLVTASLVAKNFGTHAPSVDGIINAKSKDVARRLLAAAGFPQPWFTVIAQWSPSSARQYPYPVVAKPIDDSGSVGVSVCNNDSDLHRAVTDILARRRNSRGYTLSNRVLLEEYVHGTEYSAELIHTGDAWQLMGYSDKVLGTGPNQTVETSVSFPADIPGDQAETTRAIIGWLTALGLDTPAAHVEFKVSDSGAVVPIEINPRIAGGNVSRLIAAVSGFDPMDHVLLTAAGRTAPGTSHLHIDGAATAYFPLPAQEGTVTSLQVDTADLPDEVFALSLTQSFPRAVTFPLSNYDWLGYILTKAPSRQASFDAAVLANDLIEITYATGEPERSSLTADATST